MDMAGVHARHLYPHSSLAPLTSSPPPNPPPCYVRIEHPHRFQSSSSQLIYEDRTNTEQAKSILVVNKLRTKPVIDTIDSFLE